MGDPIVIYRPKLQFQPLDELGVAEGPVVDVSCDMASVELGADVAITSVPTFCGIFQSPGDVETSISLEVVVASDTSTRWGPLVGVVVEANLWDRVDSPSSRKFKTQISFDPSLYGTTEPGEARRPSFDVPALSSPSWEVGAYVPPA